jgi:predicted ATPase/DNA-binding winged helix-turn-helix (wHTH) protein
MESSQLQYCFGHFELRPAERRLLIRGEPVKLGARAYDVLLALVERRDRLVGKNELLDIVWPGSVVEENNLQVQVSTLRRLLGPAVIATIPGRGYRFTAPYDSVPNVTLVSARQASPVDSRSLQATERVAGNVPLRLPTLVGRDAELRELIELVESHSLTTVVGAGGIGKTTLAIAAAATLRSRWSDGVWVVELAPIGSPALVPQAVAQALRIAIDGSQTAQEQLLQSLDSQSLLLVLDNCEHVIDSAGTLAEAIGARAPGVTVIATSQESLNVAGEQLFKLRPLGLPEPGEPACIDVHPALALFAVRAQAANPSFALNTTNAEVVADICRQLDGLPLAIELAAARVRMFGLLGVRDKLGDRFRLLTGGARTAMRRHQTMRATVDWSYSLLSPSEQAVLRRLGLFVGGFSLELAQAVASDDMLDEWTVLDALSSLIDKSLVIADEGEPVRYRLLETTRAFAMEKLADAGETARWMERHAHAVRDLFVDTDEARHGEDGTMSGRTYHETLAPELDNVRSALNWAMGDAQDWRSAIALSGSAAEVFRSAGLSREVMARMMAIRVRVDEEIEPLHAARFWLRLSILGSNGRLPTAEVGEAVARAQRIYREHGLRGRLRSGLYIGAWSLNMAGQSSAAAAMLREIELLDETLNPRLRQSRRRSRLSLRAAILFHQERYEEAGVALAEQEELYANEPGEEFGRIGCQVDRCLNLICLGRYDEAIETARSMIELHRGLRAGNLGFLTSHLMLAQLLQGRVSEAIETRQRFLSSWQRDGVLFYGLSALATLLAESGRLADAARIDGAAMAFIAASGVQHHPLHRRARDRMLSIFAASNVDAADMLRWQREGEALDEEAMVALCLGGGDRAAAHQVA